MPNILLLPSPVHADFHNADVQGGGIDVTTTRVSKVRVVELSGKNQRLDNQRLLTSTREWEYFFGSRSIFEPVM